MQILQQTEITSFNVLLGVLIIGIGFILGVLIYTKTYNQNVFLSFIAIGIVLGTFCGIKYQIPTGEIKYQVSLNEEIKATEFLENYEVLSKENNTYWIKREKMMEVKLTTVLEKIDKLETLTDNLLDIIKKYPKDLEAQEYLKNYGISLEIFQQCFGELEILKTNIKNELNDVKIESKYF